MSSISFTYQLPAVSPDFPHLKLIRAGEQLALTPEQQASQDTFIRKVTTDRSVPHHPDQWPTHLKELRVVIPAPAHAHAGPASTVKTYKQPPPLRNGIALEEDYGSVRLHLSAVVLPPGFDVFEESQKAGV